MVLRNAFFFAGVSSLERGLTIEDKTILNGPELDMQDYQIYGRDGDVYYSNHRRSNLLVTYDTFLKVPNGWDIDGWTTTMKGWLLKEQGRYFRLEDTYDLSHYRMAAYSGGLDIDNGWKRFTRQTATFTCKPYRYLKTGDDMVSGSAATSLTVYNPTNFDAKPLIQVTHGMSFASSAVLTISYEDGTQYEGDLSNLGQSDFAFVIDSEEQIIRNGNEQTSPELFAAELDFFPVLKPGENTITISGSGLSTLGVWPKWREL